MGIAACLKRTGLARHLKSVLRAFPARAAAAPLLRMRRKLHPAERLPPPAVEEPYRLLVYERGGEAAWLDLLSASGEFGKWTRERLDHELLSTLLPGGGIFAECGGQLVGCASACFMKEYEPDAILMYVALLPEHRGRGLGQALVWETLRVCQRENYAAMILHTENHRHAAVRTYFQLGFLPQLGEGIADKRQWADVLGRALLGGAG